MKTRIRYAPYLEKILAPTEAAKLVHSGMTLAIGGYTSSGYPKATIRALVDLTKDTDFRVNVVTGSNNGVLDELMASAGIVSHRAPMIESKTMAAQINRGEVLYVEQQMNKMPRLIAQQAFGKIDIAIVEAVALTEDGALVPTSSCGMVPNLLDAAEKIIVEINTAQPAYLEQMHDIYRPKYRQPIPMTGINHRFGTPYIQINPQKVIAVVPSSELDETKPLTAATESQKQIAQHLIAFLGEEMQRRGSNVLPPIQTGFGNMAGEIAVSLGNSDFTDIEFFCGGVQEENIELLASGKARAISCGSIKMTPRVMELLEDPEIRNRIIIRNGEITNNSETISRMGLVALNSGIEIDIYGNANSSHILGHKIVNGLGGGANFAENAELSIMLIPSEGKKGAISAIVPMVSHQDISEHDIDVVITENGVADLRGKCDIERAREIIANCASPRYRSALEEYLNKAIMQVGGHHPILLEEALSWHQRLRETGQMM